MTPELEAARANMHRLIDEAFDNDSATRVVMLVADENHIGMHAVGATNIELAQIMEIGYAQYRERFYGDAAPETLQ